MKEAKPIQTDNHHNIEVVVLPEMMASNAFTTSQATLLYSRSNFVDGSDRVLAKQLQKAKKVGAQDD